MPPPPITTHISQSPDIILHLPPQVRLERHIRHRGVQVEDLLLLQLADFGCWVDVEARHEALAGLAAYAVE